MPLRHALPWVLSLAAAAPLWAADSPSKPSVTQALQFRPIQSDLAYDIPDAATATKCTLQAEPIGKFTGWVVRNADGQLLRRFIDTNGDNKVDRWCYYKDGFEVYRDIDSDFNGKADEYRWLGIAGTRWGIDRNENGTVDFWKSISAEEVSAEIVAALREKDAERFQRLLLTPTELSALSLGDEDAKQLRQTIERARQNFASLAKNQNMVDRETQWIHFGATRPGVVPEGTNGSRKDLTVYENVVAVVETAGKAGQVPIGTLVQVDQLWRAIDLPVGTTEGQAQSVAGGFFFASARAANAPTVGSDEPQTWQPWIARLEEVDAKLIKATTPGEQAKLNAQRADIIEKLIENLPADQRETWIRQFADTVSAAIQSGNYDGGVDRLEAFYKQIVREVDNPTLHAYVKFRYISAEYGRRLAASVNDPKADIPKLQEKWLADLSGYVREYPTTPDAAEAMLQLAIAEEFAGKDSDAERWYRNIVEQFPQDPRAAKARGALTRLGSVGKSIALRGTSVTGQTIDLASLKGKTVLVHYWATWCEPCKDDLKTLRTLQEKYKAKGFTLIGIALDNDKSSVTQYLRTDNLPWPQLYEDGGLDSRFANEMGILTLPTMFLIDAQGKVVNRAVLAGQLDEELSKLLK
jgi:thiol-disulfide isomerase/thioredoxin